MAAEVKVTRLADSSMPEASAFTSFAQGHADKNPFTALALEVAHNLRYEHNWCSLRLHDRSPSNQQPLSRPLLSGLAPARVYVHPEDQIDELKKGLKGDEHGVESEWVLATTLREKWTLARLAQVFDAIPEDPTEAQGEMIEALADHEQRAPKVKTGKRRGGKRLLLATIGDDSTVVYYIVHDGIVKPRQN